MVSAHTLAPLEVAYAIVKRLTQKKFSLIYQESKPDDIFLCLTPSGKNQHSDKELLYAKLSLINIKLSLMFHWQDYNRFRAKKHSWDWEAPITSNIIENGKDRDIGPFSLKFGEGTIKLNHKPNFDMELNQSDLEDIKAILIHFDDELKGSFEAFNKSADKNLRLEYTPI